MRARPPELSPPPPTACAGVGGKCACLESRAALTPRRTTMFADTRSTHWTSRPRARSCCAAGAASASSRSFTRLRVLESPHPPTPQAPAQRKGRTAARRRRLPPGPAAGRSSGRVTAVAACVGTCTFTPPGAAWAITDPGAVFRALAAGGRRGRRDDTHAAAALWQSDVGLDPGACLNRHTTPRCVWRVPPAHCGRPARSAGYHSPLGGMRGAVRRDVQLPPRRIPW